MIDRIMNIIDELRIDKTQTLTTETQLIGSERILDSLLLVELCLKLEDLATELNFTFDWTSSDAMSRSSSMFRTINSLTIEFEKQQIDSK